MKIDEINKKSYQIEYRDLEKDYYEYNAWKTDETFKFYDFDKFNKELINQYMIVEYIFEGVRSQREENVFNQKLHIFKQGLRDEIRNNLRKNNYLILFEKTPKPKNKLRSYKGLVNKKKIDLKNFLQYEVTLKSELTIISLIAIINEKNFEYLINYFFDDTICFVIKSDHNYLKKDFLNKIIFDFYIKGNIQINYAKLLINPLLKDDILYRIGGNGGEDYWSIQKFIKKGGISGAIPIKN